MKHTGNCNGRKNIIIIRYSAKQTVSSLKKRLKLETNRLPGDQQKQHDRAAYVETVLVSLDQLHVRSATLLSLHDHHLIIKHHTLTVTLLLFFFYQGKPLVTQKLQSNYNNLFGRAPYSGGSSSVKPLCNKT